MQALLGRLLFLLVFVALMFGTNKRDEAIGFDSAEPVGANYAVASEDDPDKEDVDDDSTPLDRPKQSHWGLPLDYLNELLTSRSQLSEVDIRVKIFPHTKDQPPHRKDRWIHKLTFRSLDACRVYAGKTAEPLPRGEVISRDYVTTLDVRKMSEPVYLQCPGETRVEPVGGRQVRIYGGDFWVYPRPSGRGMRRHLEVVNVIALEEYLRGVLPAEVYPTWPDAALKSQAVAARTYAVFHMLEARLWAPEQAYDVDDTIRFQAYSGTTQHTEATDKAIADTRQQVLSYDSHIIRAFYHADSGGHTESARDIWGKSVPYAVAKPEPEVNQEIRSSRWSHRVSMEDVTKILRRRHEWDESVQIEKLTTFKRERTAGGRLRYMHVRLSNGETLRTRASLMRRELKLRSTNFRVRHEGGDVVFVGRGSGHGVGLNQKGACVLARKKQWTYEKILGHYYPGTQLCRVGGWSFLGSSSCGG